jgi:hypothetical protein
LKLKHSDHQNCGKKGRTKVNYRMPEFTFNIMYGIKSKNSAEV